jgi:hypothetical protein
MLMLDLPDKSNDQSTKHKGQGLVLEGDEVEACSGVRKVLE